MAAPKTAAPKKAGSDPTKVSSHRSIEHLETLAKVQEDRQTDALSPHHVPKLNYGYKTQRDLWLNSNEEDRHALIYGMVFHDGAIAKGMTDISRFFGLAKDILMPYKETFEMAKAALKLKVQRNVLNLGLQREDQVALKFNLLLQYAEQVVNPAHEGKDSLDQSKEVAINLNVVRNESAEVKDLRTELDSMVAQADATANKRLQ